MGGHEIEPFIEFMVSKMKLYHDPEIFKMVKFLSSTLARAEMVGHTIFYFIEDMRFPWIFTFFVKVWQSYILTLLG